MSRFLQPRTTPLNAAVSGIAAPSFDISYRLYITAPNGAVLTLQSGGQTFAVIAPRLVPAATSTGPPPPVTDLTGISPPPAPTISGVGSGGSLAAGTYGVAVTYVALFAGGGESLPSPTVFVTVPAGGLFTMAVAAPTAGPAKVELSVPRLEDWHVTRYAILVTGSITVPSCRVYIDSVAPNNLLDATDLGAQNSANADLYLRPGQVMIAQWFYTDFGAQVTLSVFGEKTA